jgi:hypothetical protein
VQDEFVASVLNIFGDGSEDSAEGLPLLHQMPGSDLLDVLGRQSIPAGQVTGGILTLPAPHSIVRGIDTFLNFMSWAAMKKLSGDVGVKGLAPSVLAAQRALVGVRIHLAGHSLGGRLVTACASALAQQGASQLASLSLLEAAFSHYGFSPDAGWGKPGFFRDVIESGIVRGPIISTFSKQDAVVGTAYAVASRLAQDSLQAIGDAADHYGGIGHNGAQRTSESTALALLKDGEAYRLQPGIVTCLDGSAGLITGHEDITNPHVTWAIASAICGAE